MNEIQIFENKEFGAIRTMSNEKGEAMFCAKDVCDALGYCNSRDAVRKHIEKEDKTTVAIATLVLTTNRKPFTSTSPVSMLLSSLRNSKALNDSNIG